MVVATVRALKLHGGADEKALAKEDVGAVERGLPNLLRHVENLRKFGLPVLVGINRFLTDTPAELELIEAQCAVAGAKAYLCEHWAKGGAGAEALARAVDRDDRRRQGGVQAALSRRHAACREDRDDRPRDLPRLGRGDRRAGADGASRRWRPRASASCRSASPRHSTASPPIPRLRGAPTGHTLPIREVRLSAGAGFVVAMAGEIMSMPGLPRVPAAERIRLTEDGQVDGIF